jgi:hypothetical protein
MHRPHSTSTTTTTTTIAACVLGLFAGVRYVAVGVAGVAYGVWFSLFALIIHTHDAHVHVPSLDLYAELLCGI